MPALHAGAHCRGERALHVCGAQATSTEVWLYRNREAREAVIAFRGTSNPQDFITDASLSLSAFSPGNRRVAFLLHACSCLPCMQL